MLFLLNVIDMKINKHEINNIQVAQLKFDVIIKWCHSKTTQTYPTCALFNLSLGKILGSR